MFIPYDWKQGASEGPVKTAAHILSCHCWNNARLKVLGYGKVVITPELTIEKVHLVESMSYNLLSVMQLCKAGYTVIFNKYHMTILFTKSLKVGFVGFVENDLYVVDFSKKT